MKLFYVTNSIIPSRTANSVHVMKMCQGLAEGGVSPHLVVPFRKTDIELDPDGIFDFYDIRTRFPLSRLQLPPRMNRENPFSLLGFLYARRHKADLIFTRCAKTAVWSALFHQPFIAELHAPPKKFEKPFWKWALTSGHCLFLIVISQPFKKNLPGGRSSRAQNPSPARRGGPGRLSLAVFFR